MLKVSPAYNAHVATAVETMSRLKRRYLKVCEEKGRNQMDMDMAGQNIAGMAGTCDSVQGLSDTGLLRPEVPSFTGEVQRRIEMLERSLQEQRELLQILQTNPLAARAVELMRRR